MPRVNPERSITNERNLAARITHERTHKHMSYEGLAKRMTDLGLPMQKTTVFKIENGSRRITVDELVGFARVFELGVEEVLIPVEFLNDREARALFRHFEQDIDLVRHLATNLMRNVGKLHDLTITPEIKSLFQALRRDPQSAETVYLSPLPEEVVDSFKRFITSVWREGDRLAKAGTPVPFPKGAADGER